MHNFLRVLSQEFQKSQKTSEKSPSEAMPG